MRILLVYARYPETFWSFKHALRFIGRKAAFPPLGLLTLAAMLPPEWDKKLVDLNTAILSEKDLQWADYVFISAMAVQQASAKEIIKRCKDLGKKIVAGGPLFTAGYEDFGFDEIDHLVLSEAESLMPALVSDLEKGCAKHIYTSDDRPDMAISPVPLWPLIDHRTYQSMAIQYSRGCPFNCEFCDIVVMNGREPRTKTIEQIVTELDAIYATGFRGSVFFVDDNFIGNKRKLKSDMLPAIRGWMDQKRHPFTFFTEASVNLADDEELMEHMIRAGFNRIFIGIETPNPEGLVECNKIPNKDRDLLTSVKKIQEHGFEVMGGFIVGFDSDPPNIFQRQINFIQKSGIVTAMVGMLNAPPETTLFKRLKAAGRIRPGIIGDNTDGSTNIIPKMPYETLVRGYRHIVTTIYGPKKYYERLITFYKNLRYRNRKRSDIQLRYFTALIRSIWFLGIKEVGRRYFWKTVIRILLRNPKVFPLAIRLAITGFHFHKIAESVGANLV
jgi:radical SAM superfamily enzyme YgiQ (UPF0313 family)